MDRLAQLRIKLRKNPPRDIPELNELLLQVLTVLESRERRKGSSQAAQLSEIRDLVKQTLAEIRNTRGLQLSQQAIAIEQAARVAAEKGESE